MSINVKVVYRYRLYHMLSTVNTLSTQITVRAASLTAYLRFARSPTRDIRLSTRRPQYLMYAGKR